MPHLLRWARRGYRYLDKCRPSQVPATSRSGVSQVQDRLRKGARPGKVLASFRDKCGLGARRVLARCRLGAGQDPPRWVAGEASGGLCV